MEILDLNAESYAQHFAKPYHFFNEAAFNALNAYKCDEVYYLAFKDSKVRLGIVFGLRNNILNSPFSAPFGGFEAVNDDVRLSQIDAALQALENWAKSRNFSGIRIVAPPFFYKPDLLAKLDNCLFRSGFEKKNIELNYAFQTSKLDENYESQIWYNARKNLKRAMQAGLSFEKLEAKDGKLAYEVIAQNRKERGFPLRMSWEQVAETTTLINADFFLVTKDAQKVAAAVVFHVAPGIVQVIYWGDLPEFSEHKTMNFLSFEVFQYYKQQAIAIVDIGPSTENSIPNHGLCEFKESIGCGISLKTEYFKPL